MPGGAFGFTGAMGQAFGGPMAFGGGINGFTGGFGMPGYPYPGPAGFGGGFTAATIGSAFGGGFTGGFGSGIGGFGANSQYAWMMQASMQSQMLEAMRAQQSQQDMMLAQQQMMEAQWRYQQTMQQMYSMGGYSMGWGSAIGTAFGGTGGRTF
jgi:hypothetical protein